MRHRKYKASMAVAALLGVALALSACGSSDDDNGESAADVYKKFDGMTGTEREDALIKAAKDEGSLDLYVAATQGEDLGKAFEAKYGIKTNIYLASADEVWQRFTQEQQANRQSTDVIIDSDEYLGSEEGSALLTDYESEVRDDMPEEARGDKFTGVWKGTWVTGYNTDLVSADELPDDLLGFADPKWKGKLAMESTDWDWYMAQFKYYQEKTGMSDEELTDVFDKIAANSVVGKGHTDQAGQLAIGQFAVALSSLTLSLDPLAADGAPVTWGSDTGKVIQPVVVSYTVAGGVANAPHPAAATLFLDFAIGDEGAQVVLDGGGVPARPVENDPLAGVETISTPTDELLAEGQDWTAKYDELLRSAGQ
jgi:iron(III) transport system substrate-binding protein